MKCRNHLAPRRVLVVSAGYVNDEMYPRPAVKAWAMFFWDGSKW